ncbi:phage holin family protein [Planococcus sp. A6]|uniref:phage holin family protein n=1 Tax=Planococcus sp. A6 TaxID=2992760 RepID=UPI00237BA2EF|nr:phage holin family protein [Planococcus sp. A6]MDE0581566.1 phage holin family protein [Planococcus sp. A6]
MDNLLLLNLGGADLEHLEVARMYLFGQVKFLDFLMVLMAFDILTGIFKAIKNGNLWSRKSLFGYARKILIFGVIIVANIIDQILGLNGAITYATVIFYIANEVLSITENLAEIGVLVPKELAEKLKVMQPGENGSLGSQLKEEMAGSKVDEELQKAKKKEGE